MKLRFGVLVLMLYPTLAVAQGTVPQVRRGTPLFFEHDDQSVLITEKYEICEDVIDASHCFEVTVTKTGTLGNGYSTFQFPLPEKVTNGAHIYSVRAFGEGEWSDPSTPSLGLRPTGKPLPPQNFRTGNTSTAPTTTTSSPTAPSTVSAPTTGTKMVVKP